MVSPAGDVATDEPGCAHLTGQKVDEMCETVHGDLAFAEVQLMSTTLALKESTSYPGQVMRVESEEDQRVDEDLKRNGKPFR